VRIPGYELLEQVGEGGRGTVYRARQVSLDRTVAVKVLRPDVPEKGQIVAFEREGRLMAALAHPNLVTIYDSGKADGQNYLVTEFVPGSTLRSRMTPGQPWPIHQALALLDSIARALTYIHEHAILHLDLKPENILFTPGGEIKIADFGLALARIDARELSALGMAQGTFDYCSPEQRFGLPTDDRSDLFSLGVIAHELLTGKLPGRVYESARQLNPRLPLSLDKVLSRALARDPSERYGSVEEFRRDLAAHLGKQRRYLRWLPALACSVVLLGVAMFLGFHGGAGPKNVVDPAFQSWLLLDDLDAPEYQSVEPVAANDGTHAPIRVLVHGLAPEGAGEPDLPAWPEPRPALVVATPRALGIVHFLEDSVRPRLGRNRWTRIFQMPQLAPEDNFVQAGGFDGDCLTADNPASPFWRIINPGLIGDNDTITIDTPPDHPNDPALLFHRKDSLTAGLEFGCYQWLARVPEQPGAVAVVRYRARAEDGASRVRITIRLPLLLPQDNHSNAMRSLRAMSEPFPGFNPSGPVEGRVCSIRDWVRPDQEWRTYCVVWEWPSCTVDPSFRNIEIIQVGVGKVWVDNVELFTLPKRANP
jgi:Protein kinase domain